jgi:hypothetical protein
MHFFYKDSTQLEERIASRRHYHRSLVTFVPSASPDITDFWLEICLGSKWEVWEGSAQWMVGSG